MAVVTETAPGTATSEPPGDGIFVEPAAHVILRVAPDAATPLPLKPTDLPPVLRRTRGRRRRRPARTSSASSTPSAAATAMSVCANALPPRLRTSMPMSVPAGALARTMPRLPSASRRSSLLPRVPSSCPEHSSLNRTLREEARDDRRAGSRRLVHVRHADRRGQCRARSTVLTQGGSGSTLSRRAQSRLRPRSGK